MKTKGRGMEGVGDHTRRGEGPRGAAPMKWAAASPGLACDGMRRVALEEMSRRRRRLGELTPTQECALESLLVSVADNIAELVSGMAATTPGQEKHEGAACAPTIHELEEAGPTRA